MKSRMLSIIIVLMLSFTLFAEEETVIRYYSFKKTEWVAFALGGSTYGFTADFSLFTIRWKHFFWEMMRVQGGTELQQSWSLKFKTTAGYPIFFNLGRKNEIRLGTGVGIGYNHHESTDSYVEVLAEMTYINHLSDNIAFQIKLGSGFPLDYKFQNTADCMTPDGELCYKAEYIPDLYLLLGVRF